MTRRLIAFALGAALMLGAASRAQAHEFTLEAVLNAFVKVEPAEVHVVVRAPLYLFRQARIPSRQSEIDIDAAGPALGRALDGLQQGLVLTEDGRTLKASTASVRLSLPSDRSFETYEQAVAHVATPIEPGTRIVVDQGYVDAHLVYPTTGGSRAVYALRSTIAPELGEYFRLALRYIAPDGSSRALVVRNPREGIELNPSWIGTARGFIALGISHIATGWDHLLFLLCLVVPLRRWQALLAVVTAFTLAHSVTLVGSAFGLAPRGAWFPPLVEAGIAASIVYAAIENIVGVTARRRVVLALLFGLVHGFGFSSGLQQELQFAGDHLLVALFAFNIGVEIGQIIALALMLPVLVLVTRHLLHGRLGTIVLSTLIAHAGWHWMEERWQALAQVPWPQPDLAGIAWLALWVSALVLVAAGAGVLVQRMRLEGVADARS